MQVSEVDIKSRKMRLVCFFPPFPDKREMTFLLDLSMEKLLDPDRAVPFFSYFLTSSCMPISSSAFFESLPLRPSSIILFLVPLNAFLPEKLATLFGMFQLTA